MLRSVFGEYLKGYNLVNTALGFPWVRSQPMFTVTSGLSFISLLISQSGALSVNLALACS